jgi:hypothetical protein
LRRLRPNGRRKQVAEEAKHQARAIDPGMGLAKAGVVAGEGKADASDRSQGVERLRRALRH